MSPKLIDLYRKAENDLLEVKLDEALAGFASVVQADPDHLWSRFMVGRVLQQMKATNRAFEVYNAVAWHCLKAGYPLLGLVAVKHAGELQATVDDTLQIMSDLYSLESDRVNQDLSLFDAPQLDPDATTEEVLALDDKLASNAEQLAKTFTEVKYPVQLPPVPLFSLLSTEAFYPILEMLEARSYKPGETIVKEGDPCTSIYILAHGEVEVHEGSEDQGKTLARLVSGSVFGEMALITDGPRVASAKAIRESQILELRLQDLDDAAEDLDDITWAVAKFTRQRFLNNLLVTSPVFAPFSPEERKEILERFSSIGVPTDEVIIREGSAGPGLYLILGGEAEVAKFEGGSQVHLATLKEGAIFGEISLVRDSPTTATVKAIRGGEFLFLSREDFQELVAERPEIKEALAELSDERLAEQHQAIHDANLISEDGAILF